MKMIPWTKVFLLASTMTVGVACSDSNGGDTPAAAPPTANTATTGDTAVTEPGSTAVTDNGTTLGAALSCDDAWALYVKARPLGFLVAYKITSQNTGADGSIIPSAASSYEDVVLASDETHVLSKHTVTVQGLAQAIVSDVDLTKLQWIAGCRQGSSAVAGLPSGVPSNVTFEILEKGPQSVQVEAGTFTADHVKGKSSATDTQSGTVFDSWILQDGSGILVKAVTETTADINGSIIVSNVAVELTKLVRP